MEFYLMVNSFIKLFVKEGKIFSYFGIFSHADYSPCDRILFDYDVFEKSFALLNIERCLRIIGLKIKNLYK